MSNSDSFIDEVTEEVRRDRLYKTLRRYGWIAVLAVLLIVGGTAWREYALQRDAARAQAFGDAILDALEADPAQARIAALEAIAPPEPASSAILSMLIAAERAEAGAPAEAVAALRAIAEDTDVPQIYRQIASYKALARGDAGLTLDERRSGLEALAIVGQPLRLLAEEQLALIEIEAGEPDAAVMRLQAIVEDAEATADLRSRAAQLIVALGGAAEDG